MLAANELGSKLVLLYGAEQPPKPKAGSKPAGNPSKAKAAKEEAKEEAKPAAAPLAARALVDPTCGLPSSAPSDPFYVTTAINYTNGAPHIGHVW